MPLGDNTLLIEPPGGDFHGESARACSAAILDREMEQFKI
jgi:hypothetical protein